MVTVDDRREIRYHRARKAWPCAAAGSDCQGAIAPGERYAEVRHAGLSDRTFGKRFCLACAGALPASPNGSAAVASVLPDMEATTADIGGLRAPVERGREQSVAHVVRLVVLWVLAVALSLGALYATMRVLDWFIQIMHQPMRPGGTT